MKTRLGVDRVKPWSSVAREVLILRQAKSFPDTRLTFKVRKVMGGVVGGLDDYSVSPIPSPFPLDF